jgi:hypothetical protein
MVISFDGGIGAHVDFLKLQFTGVPSAESQNEKSSEDSVQLEEIEL